MLNFYCDESTHLRNGAEPYMLLGFVCCPSAKLKYYRNQINDIKERHHYFHEIKWSGLSNSKKDFYLELVDFFFDNDLSFSTVVIDKRNFKMMNYHQFEELYYKMYFELLSKHINPQNQYNIYLDIKDTLSAWKVNRLKKLLHDKHGAINNLQNIKSQESLFLQIADVLMGAINYDLRGEEKVMAKKEVIDRIKVNVDNKSWRITENNKFNVQFV